MSTQQIHQPETFSQYEDQLTAGNNLFVCGKCGHKIGDPRSRNFLTNCSGCDSVVQYHRIIE